MFRPSWGHLQVYYSFTTFVTATWYSFVSYVVIPVVGIGISFDMDSIINIRNRMQKTNIKTNRLSYGRTFN
jgi:hypothetical protein